MKAARDGLRIADLVDEPFESFEKKLRLMTDNYRKRYGDLLKYSVEDELKRYKEYKEKLRPYTVDAVKYMRIAQEQKRSVLVEGSQALSKTAFRALVVLLC
jgi:adenylosuccinate synthase